MDAQSLLQHKREEYARTVTSIHITFPSHLKQAFYIRPCMPHPGQLQRAIMFHPDVYLGSRAIACTALGTVSCYLQGLLQAFKHNGPSQEQIHSADESVVLDLLPG